MQPLGIHRLVLALALVLALGCEDIERHIGMAESIHQILSEYPDATVGISIRDLQSGFGFDVNGERVFHAASTMKVPVMIEAFRQAETGRFALSDSLLLENNFHSIVDGSPYVLYREVDSDTLIYDYVNHKVEIGWLVERMITLSSDLATNVLIDLLDADSVQATIESLGTDSMRVYRGVEDLLAYQQGLNNTATSADLATILVALANDEVVSPESDSAMLEILKRQEFDEMIPAGLPPGTVVAHKTGWITQIDHDAAIVYPEGRRPYVLVILIEGIEDKAVSSGLGASIARQVHESVTSESR